MKHRILHFIKRIYNKYAPKEQHLKGTILHKILGDRIYDPALWKPTKNGIVWAFTVGTFVGFTPFWGGQMVIAGLLAVLLRINIPVSLLMVWITNPLTAFFIYTLEIKIGLIILGNTDGFHRVTSVKDLVAYLLPLSVGGAITSIVMGILAYILINIMFKLGLSIKEHNPIHIPHIKIKKSESN